MQDPEVFGFTRICTQQELECIFFKCIQVIIKLVFKLTYLGNKERVVLEVLTR